MHLLRIDSLHRSVVLPGLLVLLFSFVSRAVALLVETIAVQLPVELSTPTASMGIGGYSVAYLSRAGKLLEKVYLNLIKNKNYQSDGELNIVLHPIADHNVLFFYNYPELIQACRQIIDD